MSPEEKEIRQRDIDLKVQLITSISQLTRRIDTLTRQNARPPFALHVIALVFITGAALGFSMASTLVGQRSEKGAAHAYVLRPDR